MEHLAAGCACNEFALHGGNLSGNPADARDQFGTGIGQVTHRGTPYPYIYAVRKGPNAPCPHAPKQWTLRPIFLCLPHETNGAFP
ncbi:hypothetical protein GCM10009075_19480 [Sphingomonas trueperi]